MKKMTKFSYVFILVTIIFVFSSCQDYISSDVYSKPVYYQNDNTLLFAAGYKGEERLFVLDKEKKTLHHILPEIKNILLPNYSVELDLIAFGQVSKDHNNSNIWITDPEGNNKTQLTNTDRLEERPFFSNDFKYIYYLKHDIGRKYFINRVNIKTLQDEQITKESFWIIGLPVLSSDNRFIYFSKMRELTNEILIRYDSKNKSAKELVREGYGYMPFVKKNNQLYFAGRNYTFQELSSVLENGIVGQTGFISGIYTLSGEGQEWKLLMKFPWDGRYIQYSSYSDRILIFDSILNISEIDLSTQKVLGKYNLKSIPIFDE